MNQSLYFAMCAGLVMSPLFFLRDRRLGAVPVALGAVGFLAMLLPHSGGMEERERFTPSRELSEAVADPDNARLTLSWAHAE
jgi:hypothetical protein